jgi:hypothetical protein
MTPELKFHSIVISITTAIVFSIWYGLTSIISAYPWLTIVLSALISLGIYRLLALLLLSILRNVKCVKIFILGPYFMEGTWAGFFVGHDNKPRLFMEIFEQDLSSLVIRGRAFKEDGTFHGSWLADSANIDPKRARLSYYYDADVVGNTHINPGLARFDMDRSASHKPAEKLVGYSSDLFSPAKLMAFEEKISVKTTIESTKGLEAARKLYEKYKSHIPTNRPEEQ